MTEVETTTTENQDGSIPSTNDGTKQEGDAKVSAKTEWLEKLKEANRVKLLSWSMLQLKGLYTKLNGQAYKGKDKQQLARLLANKLAEHGAKASDPPDDIEAQAPELKVEDDEARELLQRVKTNWDEVDALKAERREACSDIRAEISVAREKIAKALDAAAKADNDGDGDAARKALRKIDAEWRKIGRRSKDLDATRKEYTERINAASGRIRDVLSNMRQGELDFSGYDPGMKDPKKDKPAKPKKTKAAKASTKGNGSSSTKPAKRRGASKNTGDQSAETTAAPSSAAPAATQPATPPSA